MFKICCSFIDLAVLVVMLITSQTSHARELVVFHLSDSHQILEPGTSGSISLARALTQINALKAQNPGATFLIVHSGDFLSPSETSRAFKGQDIMQALAKLGVSVATIGNHEFDYRLSTLLQRAQDSPFPFISANLKDSTGTPLPHIRPYFIHEVDGRKIAFFGLTTVNAVLVTTAKFGDDVTPEDPVSAASRVVQELKAKHQVDMIVGLTHLESWEDLAVLESVKGIDLILGGHVHQLIEQEVNGVPIRKVRNDVQDFSVTRIDLSANPARFIDSKIISLSRDIPEDPELGALLNQIRKDVQVQNTKVIGHLPESHDGTLQALAQAYRTTSPEIGTWVVGLFQEALQGDVGFMNVGIVSRSNRIFGPGPLTMGDVNALFPWDDPPVLIEINGAVLRAKLERMINAALNDIRKEKETDTSGGLWSGKFPIVSGLEVNWDWLRPEGSRITRLIYKGEELKDEQLLKVVVNLYIYKSDLVLKGEKLLTGPVRSEYEILTERLSARYGTSTSSGNAACIAELTQKHL